MSILARLEYALRYRDRFIAAVGMPVAVLREFWEEQEVEFVGDFTSNSLSALEAIT